MGLFFFTISIVPPLLIILYFFYSLLGYVFFQTPILKSNSFITPVSIIIACYNEENYIRDKIISFLDKEEWIEGSEIIIVSAGSTDSTNDILSEFKDSSKVKVILNPTQISKIKAVNIAVSHSKNKILVFSDCRQKMKKKSVKHLVQNFNDDSVGTVVSVLEDFNKSNKQSLFRRFLNLIVYFDSKISSGLNVYGALYAQKKSIFRKFPTNLLFDDLFVVLSTLSQDKRLIQEPNAVIYDVNFHSYYGHERLERLVRGLLIFIVEQWELFMKVKKVDFVRFLIFKYVKLLFPLTFIIWFLFGLYYSVIFSHLGLVLVIYAILFGLLLIPKSRDYIFFICRINFYFFLAIFKFVFFQKRSTKWDKLKRSK